MVGRDGLHRAQGGAQAAVRTGLGGQRHEAHAPALSPVRTLPLDGQRHGRGKIALPGCQQLLHEAAVLGGIPGIGTPHLDLPEGMLPHQRRRALDDEALTLHDVLQFQQGIVIVTVAVGDADDAGGPVAVHLLQTPGGHFRYPAVIAGHREHDDVPGTEIPGNGATGDVQLGKTFRSQGRGKAERGALAAAGGRKIQGCDVHGCLLCMILRQHSP